MNKTELITAIAERGEMTKKDAEVALNSVLETIKDSLTEGEPVKIFQFGNFEVRERAARKGRNPQTGEEIDIAASKYPAFKPAQKLKNIVKES
ncbi:HU family DNA-binding protein [Oceanobacillus sp. FSL H7-0719]|uniref:HU family DNA-binding protein n=1 Tax=Oceanobacillus sp. FSL H7-0719 TaxID=2954507 RepID=UPI003251C799